MTAGSAVHEPEQRGQYRVNHPADEESRELDRHTLEGLIKDWGRETVASWMHGREPDPAAAPAFASLAELLDNPALLLPPQCVVPRLDYRGRTTLLVGPDKSGKSTMVAGASAAVTNRGEFFGELVSVEHARVCWVGLEEALGDAVRRFHDLGARADSVQLLVLRPTNLLEEIRALFSRQPFDQLVVDSVTEYARVTLGAVPEDGDTSGWAGVIRPLVGLTREFESLSALLIHHPRRSDGQYRGPGELAAAVDCLLEMRLPSKDEDASARHITGRARWPVLPFTVTMRNGRYQLAGSTELSLDARVLLHIEQNPGISANRVRAAVGARTADVVDAINRLLARRAIENRGTDASWKLFTPGQQTGFEL